MPHRVYWVGQHLGLSGLRFLGRNSLRFVVRGTLHNIFYTYARFKSIFIRDSYFWLHGLGVRPHRVLMSWAAAWVERPSLRGTLHHDFYVRRVLLTPRLFYVCSYELGSRDITVWAECHWNGRLTHTVLSTNQIAVLSRATPAIYQSYLPDGWNYPAYIAHRTRTRIYKNAQHTAAHATIDVRSPHRTNPRSTRFVSGKASENWRRPRTYHLDPLSRRREVAHGVLRSPPKPEQTVFFA